MADEIIERAVRDAKASLAVLRSYLEPLSTLDENLSAMAESVLDEAKQRAEQAVAAAEAHAGKIVSEAEAKVKALHEATAEAAGKHDGLVKAIAELEGNHASLAAAIEADQAHLNNIRGEIAATLAKFAPKA